MASAAEAQGLPVLYNDLVPLSKNEHAAWKMRPMQTLSVIGKTHAVPLTVDEFGLALRYYPIVFSSGADPVPLALMGLNEGANVFIDDEGQPLPNIYIPAYVRRYPFMLARLRADAEEMSLCFDPTAELLGTFEEGVALFNEDGEPSQQTTDTLGFCEQFELSGQRTAQFARDLVESGLLEDGEVSIQHEKAPQPYIYRGFQMVNEGKLRDLRGDQLRKMNQNGMLTLIHAHLFSLSLMTDIFNRQMEQGKVPPQFSISGG